MLAGSAPSTQPAPCGLPALVTAPAGHPGDEGVARTPKGARARSELIDATVALVAEGNLRPTPAQVARRAGRGKSHVHTHFDCMHMLQRATVRARTAELVVALKLPTSLTADERERLVWLIVAGVEKPR